jgi:hypothetical protein
MRRLFAGALLAGLITLRPAGAAAQQSTAPDQAPNTGQDLFKPPPNLFQLLYGYKTAPGGGGTAGASATVTTDTVDLRFDHRVDLSQQSLIALRADLPILAKNPITSDNPNGDYLTAWATSTPRPSSSMTSTRVGRRASARA